MIEATGVRGKTVAVGATPVDKTIRIQYLFLTTVIMRIRSTSYFVFEREPMINTKARTLGGFSLKYFYFQ